MVVEDADVVGAIAAYLVDAARQEASVRSVLPVLRHYQSEGATKDWLLSAAVRALQARPTWPLLHEYESAIHQL